MIIDTTDQVAELKALDSSPFPIDYRRASVHVPLIDESAVPVNYADYADIIREIDQVERYIAEQSAAQLRQPPSPSRHVTFGTTAVTGGRQFSSGQEFEAAGYPPILPPMTNMVPMDDSLAEYHDPKLGIHKADVV